MPLSVTADDQRVNQSSPYPSVSSSFVSLSSSVPSSEIGWQRKTNIYFGQSVPHPQHTHNACTQVSTHACMHTHTHMPTQMKRAHTHTHTHTHAHTHTRIHTHTHTCMYTCTPFSSSDHRVLIGPFLETGEFSPLFQRNKKKYIYMNYIINPTLFTKNYNRVAYRGNTAVSVSHLSNRQSKQRQQQHLH